MTDQFSEELEQIRQQSILVSQRPDVQEIQDRLQQLLRACNDRESLQGFFDTVAYTPEIAIPVMERLLQLNDGDVTLILRFGQLLFMAGEDEAARVQLDRAKAIEGETARVLKLEAALAGTNEEKHILYSRIMVLDPGDREVWQYLIALNR